METIEDEQKRLFEEKFLALRYKKKSSFISKERYDYIMSIVQDLEAVEHKDRGGDYYNFKKMYSVLKLGGEPILVRKIENIDLVVDFDSLLRVAFNEQIFDILKKVHDQTLIHASGRKMWELLKKQYSNISNEVCDIFKMTCPVCCSQKRVPARPEDYKPILSETLNSRGQVDLIDMQSCAFEKKDSFYTTKITSLSFHT